MEGLGVEVCGEGVGQPPSSAAESDADNGDVVQKRKRQINKKKIMETRLECLRLAIDVSKSFCQFKPTAMDGEEIIKIAELFYDFINKNK